MAALLTTTATTIAGDNKNNSNNSNNRRRRIQPCLKSAQSDYSDPDSDWEPTTAAALRRRNQAKKKGRNMTERLEPHGEHNDAEVIPVRKSARIAARKAQQDEAS